MPRTLKPAAKRAPRKKAAPTPVPDDLQRQEAEADALDADWMTVPMGGVPYRVLPFTAWPRSVYRGMRNQGNFEALADVVHPDDREAWLAADCTVGELGEWVNDAMEAAGQAAGESRPSNASSRNTRWR